MGVGRDETVRKLTLPCGCEYVCAPNFIGGGRRHECGCERTWVISAEVVRDVRYHVAEKIVMKNEEGE